MARFMAVNDIHADDACKEVLINLDWVEDVRPTKAGGACFFFAFESCEGLGQDRIITDRPYQLIRQKLLER